MRIIIVADFIYPNFTGGSARYADNLIRGLDHNNVDFKVITRQPKGIYSTEDRDPFYEQLKASGKLLETSGFIDLYKAVKTINKTDIIHTHHPVLGLMVALLKPKNPLVHTFHGPIHAEYEAAKGKQGMGYHLRRSMQNLLLKRAQCIYTLSKYMQSQLPNAAEKTPQHIVGPLVDLNAFQKPDTNPMELKIKHGLNPAKRTLITTRRLTRRTGVAELIEWFNQSKLAQHYELVITGQGELSTQISTKAKQHPDIHYLGYVSDEAMKALLCLSHAYVLPSIELEGFGLVILEALALNLPVIATHTSGGGADFLKTIDPHLVFDLNKAPQSWVEAIQHVAAQYPNGINAQNKIQAFDFTSLDETHYDALINLQQR